jgi:hypothetical protein
VGPAPRSVSESDTSGIEFWGSWVELYVIATRERVKADKSE